MLILFLLIVAVIAYSIFCSEKEGMAKYFCTSIFILIPLLTYFFLLKPYYENKKQLKEEVKNERRALRDKKSTEAEIAISESIIKYYEENGAKINTFKKTIENPNIDGTYNYLCTSCKAVSGIVKLDDIGSKVILNESSLPVSDPLYGGLLLELYNMRTEFDYHELEYDDGCYGFIEILAPIVTFEGHIVGSVPLYSFFRDQYGEVKLSEPREYIMVSEAKVKKRVIEKLGENFNKIFE